MGKPLIVVLGAGLGGTIASYEIKAALKDRADVMTVSDSDTYSFIPSNPWVAVRWREAEAIRVHLPPVMKKKGIGFTSVGAKRVHPGENRLELNDGTSLSYDWLVIATGPGAASRRGVGTAVFAGMLAASVIGVFLIPVLYVVFQRLREWVHGKRDVAPAEPVQQAAE